MVYPQTGYFQSSFRLIWRRFNDGLLGSIDTYVARGQRFKIEESYMSR
jgi:hypothetical protein